MAQPKTPAVTVRQMTLCSRYFARSKNQYVRFPELVLRGKWLKETGFKTGHVVDIACENGKLVITVAKEQRFDHL
ncbi:MAG: SymE family type I addiction module toxin [Agriterribacter sp.]